MIVQSNLNFLEEADEIECNIYTFNQAFRLHSNIEEIFNCSKYSYMAKVPQAKKIDFFDV